MYRCLKPSQDLQMLLTVRIRMKNDNNFNKSSCSNRDNINGSFFYRWFKQIEATVKILYVYTDVIFLECCG